jgi:hypothetical protein
MRAPTPLFFFCAVFSAFEPTSASAQDGAEAQVDVALFTSGAAGSAVSEAFAGLVPLPAERRIDGFDDAELRAAENDETLGYVVTIATDRDLVQVLRRADGARFERRFVMDADNAYAMALVATELLEVARSGGDPATLGLVATTSVEGTEESVTGDHEGDRENVARSRAEETEDRPEDGEENGGSDTGDGELVDAPSASGSSHWSLTMGAHAELWTSPSDHTPWLLQPGLFVEVLLHTGTLLLGVSIEASGVGAYEGVGADAAAIYRRYDVGGRVSAGFDVGPAATRLLLHFRGGGSVVTADGRTTTLAMQEKRNESTGASYFGLGVSARQPIVAGLSIHLTLGADLLPAPVQLLTFGETVVGEGSLRLLAQLGACWVVE